MNNNKSLQSVLLADGIPFLLFTGLVLVFSGMLVIAQSFLGHFLPHDVAYIGMDAQELGKYNDAKIVNFMFHDRVSFGGSIVAVGLLYMWLAEFKLKHGETWAWYLFLFSGIIGFGSFLSYLGYGYGMVLLPFSCSPSSLQAL